MSDKAKIMKEVKIVLRALLLSAPMGLTAGEIERDFSGAQGYGVPYRQLGYNSTSDLVEDLPDVANCVWERGHAVFRGVADKSTKHIQSLVSRQNVDVRKCLKRRNALERQVTRSGRGGYSGPGRSYSYNSSSSRQYQPHNGPYTRPPQGPGGGRRTNSYPGSSRAQPTTINQTSSPAYLRTQLKSLLTTHPNGILNSHFDSIFSRKFGFPIDYAKLGFSDLADLAKSSSSFISVERLGDDKFRIYTNENFPKGSGESLSKTEAKATQENVWRPPPKIIPLPDTRKPLPFDSSQKPGAGRARRISANRSSGSSARTGSTESAPSPRKASGSSPTNDLIDRQLCKEIQQILADHPDGIFAASLPSEYKALTKKELPLISIGFYSVVELVSAIPEIVAIERQKKNSDWKLFDARTFVPTKSPEPERKKRPPASSSSSQNAEDGQRDEAKTNIRNVLLAHPTGVLLQDFSAEYEKFHKTSLPYQVFGVNDVNSLVLEIPDTIKVVYMRQNQVYLHAQDQRLPHDRPLYSTISKSIPQDAIGYGYAYPAAKKPKLNQYFPIFISTVYTPHKISIQLKDKEANLALESLMDQLESVYSYPEGEKYLIPDAMIAVNQICCALYHEDNNWHRGLITGVPNMDLVEVLYVDYGTSLRIPKYSLRLLKACFMKLPMQALDARLAGIEPVGDQWGNEARDWLLSLSLNKPLLAYAVEEKKSVVSLLLCDTSTEEDLHINDMLVSQGMAQFSEQMKPAEPARKEDLAPPPPEMSLQMLTGIGLPVPEDDSFQWPDESSEVQQIMGTVGPGGDGQAIGSRTTKMDEQAVKAGADGDSGPSSLQEEDNQEMKDEMIDKMARELSEIEEEPADSQQFLLTVKEVDLITGQTLHLISFGGQGQYVTSVEIAHLIWSKDQEENALFDMIEQKAAQLGQVIVEELDNEELAKNLAREGVPLSSVQPSRLQLFLLTSVAPLVQVSGHAKSELILQLQAIADEMPPLEDDDFSRESISSETSGSAEQEMDASELQKMHDVLRVRRERILKDLMSNTGVSNVDDLTHIERLMREIEGKLERLKSVEAEASFATGSIGEISAQLGQTSLGSSISLPDDVFGSTHSAFNDSLMSSELPTRDNQSQTVVHPGQRRHASDKTVGVGHKQTATISPLQRKSTGSALSPRQQKGIGRGAQRMPTGIGRGQQIQNVQDQAPRMMYPEGLMSLNPNSPVFVPSPKRDSTGSIDLLPPPDNFFANPFANPPPPLLSSGGMSSLGGSQHGMLQGSFQDVPPILFKGIPMLPPNMPPMPSRTASMRVPTNLPPPNMIRPNTANFLPGIGLATQSFPTQQPQPNSAAPGLSLPGEFDLMPPLFNPNMPPPPLFGLGRGHQAWSIND